MRIKLIISILTCAISLLFTGCSKNDIDPSEYEALLTENEALSSENSELKDQIKLLEEEKQTKADEIEKLKSELSNFSLESTNSNNSDKSINSLTVTSFEEIGETGPIITYCYNGKEYTQELDIINNDMYSLFPTNCGFDYELGDLTNDDKDDLLVNMYFPNNVSETLCSSYIFILDDSGFNCSRVLDALLCPDEQFKLYGDVHIEDDKISLIGYHKSNGDLITESGYIEYIDNNWQLINNN